MSGDRIMIDSSSDDKEINFYDSIQFFVQKVRGDGHCIVRCFSIHFDMPVPEILLKVHKEFKNREGLYNNIAEI